MPPLLLLFQREISKKFLECHMPIFFIKNSCASEEKAPKPLNVASQ